MSQIIPLSPRQSTTLMGLAKNMASGMENGTRAMQRVVETDDGRIIFQRLGDGAIRALVEAWPTVVGFGTAPNLENGLMTPLTRAYLWRGERMRVLPDLPMQPGHSFRFGSAANAVSANGKVIVGVSGRRAVVWEGMSVSLLPTPEGVIVASAVDISSDGRIIIGTTNKSKPCMWIDRVFSELTGMPPSPHGESWQAATLSGDGQTVGCVEEGAYAYTGRTCVWRDGVSEVLSPAAYMDVAPTVAVSADGSTVAWGSAEGTVYSVNKRRSGVTEPLGLGGYSRGYARAVSPSGLLVVGGVNNSSTTNSTAAAWSETATGSNLRILAELPSGGITPHVSLAQAVSSSGNLIVGTSDRVPVIWTANGVARLKQPPGDTYGEATGVTD